MKSDDNISRSAAIRCFSLSDGSTDNSPRTSPDKLWCKATDDSASNRSAKPAFCNLFTILHKIKSEYSILKQVSPVNVYKAQALTDVAQADLAGDLGVSSTAEASIASIWARSATLMLPSCSTSRTALSPSRRARRQSRPPRRRQMAAAQRARLFSPVHRSHSSKSRRQASI